MVIWQNMEVRDSKSRLSCYSRKINVLLLPRWESNVVTLPCSSCLGLGTQDPWGSRTAGPVAKQWSIRGEGRPCHLSLPLWPQKEKKGWFWVADKFAVQYGWEWPGAAGQMTSHPPEGRLGTGVSNTQFFVRILHMNRGAHKHSVYRSHLIFSCAYFPCISTVTNCHIINIDLRMMLLRLNLPLLY